MEGILTCLICILTSFFVVFLPEDSKFLFPENKALMLSRLETEKVPSVTLTFKENRPLCAALESHLPVRPPYQFSQMTS